MEVTVSDKRTSLQYISFNYSRKCFIAQASSQLFYQKFTKKVLYSWFLISQHRHIFLLLITVQLSKLTRQLGEGTSVNITSLLWYEKAKDGLESQPRSSKKAVCLENALAYWMSNICLFNPLSSTTTLISMFGHPGLYNKSFYGGNYFRTIVS